MPAHTHTLECADARVCKLCDVLKFACEFYKNSKFVCKPCYLERGNKARRERLKDPEYRESYNAYMRERTANMDEQQLLERQLRTYDMTLDDFERMLKEQNGCCKICEKPFMSIETRNGRRLHIDHKHGTKIVRGLLCPNCNLMLGHAKDSVSTLAKAIEYLADGEWLS